MGRELINVINQIEREKGIDKEVLIDVVTSAVLSASKKNLNFYEDSIEAEFNKETGEIEVYINKKIVGKSDDAIKEISLKEAIKLNPDAQLDEYIKIPYKAGGLGRISAQLAKQVIIQKVREAEKESIFNDYKTMKGELVSGAVSRFERGDAIVDLGKTEGLLPRHEQAFRERFKRGDRVRVYIIDVKRSSKRPQVILSRTHPDILNKLFEIEVPEILEGIIEIKNSVREPNGRSKIAVHSREKDVDAVGACVGIRGVRVQSVVQELRGEKIDIVEWSDDTGDYITNALKPAKISKVNVSDKEERRVEVIVPQDQLSLAIGKSGQNVRLAARLTGWKIDIKNEADCKKEAELKLKAKKEEDEIKLLDISEIKQIKGLSAILYEHNIKNVGDLMRAEKDDLLSVPSIGEKRAEKIIAAVTDFVETKKVEGDAEAPDENDENNDDNNKEVISQDGGDTSS